MGRERKGWDRKGKERKGLKGNGRDGKGWEWQEKGRDGKRRVRRWGFFIIFYFLPMYFFIRVSIDVPKAIKNILDSRALA